MNTYLDLLREVLLHSFWHQPKMDGGGNIVPMSEVTAEELEMGKCAYPFRSFTMIGRRRLNNIRELCGKVLENGIEGGFAECGVWRGGACIYARACLPPDRPIYVCDSFDGFPPDPKEPWWQNLKCLRVPVSEVKFNFERLGVSLENVRFIAGFFAQSLQAINGKLSILRLDGDSYANTFDCLKWLWPNLSTGGYLIVDDYLIVPECKKAVCDFFQKEPEVNKIDDSGIWIQKP